MSESFEIYLTGKVSEGKLTGIPKKKLASDLKFFEGKSVELIIRKKKKYRSIQQNRVQWWYYTEIGNHLGYTPDEVHSLLGQELRMIERVDENTGLIRKFPQSTKEYSTIDHMDYTEKIRRWAAKEGIYLPEPNEQLTIKN